MPKSPEWHELTTAQVLKLSKIDLEHYAITVRAKILELQRKISEKGRAAEARGGRWVLDHCVDSDREGWPSSRRDALVASIMADRRGDPKPELPETVEPSASPVRTGGPGRPVSFE